MVAPRPRSRRRSPQEIVTQSSGRQVRHRLCAVNTTSRRARADGFRSRAGDAARRIAEADAVGPTAAHVGMLDDTGVLALRTTEGEATVWSLREEPLTGLAAEPFTGS